VQRVRRTRFGKACGLYVKTEYGMNVVYCNIIFLGLFYDAVNGVKW
jgi:hypothetical protein